MSDRARHPEDLLGAYVLGACPPKEAAQVAAHVATCESCAQQAERLARGAAALRADVPPATPSREVKDRLMAEVRAEAELFDAARARREAPDGGDPRRTSRWRTRLLPALRLPRVAFASVLIALVAGTLVVTQLNSEPERRVLSAMVDRELAPRGSATLEIHGDQSRLRVEGFPKPGRGRTYQVWTRAEREAPRPTQALFDVDASGRGETALGRSLRDADQLLVTSEPTGGSAVPTRVPVMRVEI